MRSLTRSPEITLAWRRLVYSY